MTLSATLRPALLPVLVVLLTGSALTFWSWHSLRSQNEAVVAELTAREAEQAMQAFSRRIELYQYGLRGARGAVVMAAPKLSRELFVRYSRTRDVDVEFPGSRGFGFIRRVPDAELGAFLDAARADGWPEFELRQLTPWQGEHWIIQYIEPVSRNRQAVGLDIASELNRRRAAKAAMETGRPQLTGPITLVQASGLKQQSFLLLMPVYEEGVMPPTVQERRRLLLGWSYTPLATQEALSGMGWQDGRFSWRLSDVTPGEAPSVFFVQHSPRLMAAASRVIEHDVYGRRWRLEFGTTDLFVQRLALPAAHDRLLVGGVITALGAVLAGLVAASRARRTQWVEQRARLAAVVDNSADAIIGLSLDGRVTSWNAGAKIMFGFDAQETIGQLLSELIVPIDRRHEESALLMRAGRGERVPSFETLRRAKSGRVFHVAVAVTPVCGVDGRVEGLSKQIRDITLEKESEAQVRLLNASLEAQVVERTAALQQTNQLLNNVLNASSEVSIIAADPQGVITLFNTGAERLLGYQREDVVGKMTPAPFHLREEIEARGAELSAHYGVEISGFRVFVHRAEQAGADIRDWTYVRHDGGLRRVSLAVTPMRNTAGAITGYLGIAIDVTEQRAQRAALVAARDQLALAAEVAEMGIWVWEIESNALLWNSRMFDLYDQPPSLGEKGELAYHHWRDRVYPDDVEATEQCLLHAVAGEGDYNPVFRVLRTDGSIRTVQAGAQVERDEHGKALRVTGFNRDITGQRELEQHLRSAKVLADEASAAKSSFVANMSHEIRTPLNAVLGLLQLLESTALDERQHDYVSKAGTAARALLGLLNDVLDFSKIDAGKLVLEPIEFELDALLRDLGVMVGSAVYDKPMELLFNVDADVPERLFADRMRLQQVLLNLVSNALKFTQNGQVVVSVRMDAHAAGKVTLTFSVEDSGIGIATEQLQKIFEGFVQAEASTTRRFGGTGLGLAISRKLIELMGGALLVESSPGVGSRFSFTLTLPCSDEARIELEPRRLRVLVVDDHPLSAQILYEMAQAAGWYADYRNDAAAGVLAVRQAQLEGEPYDVVLMDWRMPGIDGISAAEQIKAGPAPWPVVIILTACGWEILAAVDGPRPYAAVLGKPITRYQLVETVYRCCDGSTPAPTPVSGGGQELAGLRVLLVEDNALNRLVATELLQSRGANVDVAEDGVEAVETVRRQGADTYDVVLMDMQMPRMDGLEATKLILAEPGFAGLPIIAMTANASLEDRQACLNAGMRDHVAKPIDIAQVVPVLQPYGRHRLLVKDLAGN
ncbi:CHASE domain-containing protein [Chitinibacteraceae bacterium HSL-7]